MGDLGALGNAKNRPIPGRLTRLLNSTFTQCFPRCPYRDPRLGRCRMRALERV